MNFDLSVVLTANNETLVCGPSLRAAEASIRAAESAGFTVERLAVLDDATDETLSWLTQPELKDWQIVQMANGDVGLTRNQSILIAQGENIAFLDADDMFSENWLKRGLERLKQLEAEGYKAIIHPELNWVFDGENSVFTKPDQFDPLFLPHYFYFMNYYDSLCISPREAHVAHPYIPRNIRAGLAYQDWKYAIDTMADGWIHANAPDTIIFKRRRIFSLGRGANDRKAIVPHSDAMGIDRVASLAVVDGAVPPVESKQLSEGNLPFYGPILSNRIKAAKATKSKFWRLFNRRACGRIEPHFDHAQYLATNADIAAAQPLDLVTHYIRYGGKEGRDPNAWFVTNTYLRKNPAVAKKRINAFDHWLSGKAAKDGKYHGMDGFDEICEGLGLSGSEALKILQSKHTDLRLRLTRGELGAQVVAAARFDPLVEHGWPNALRMKIPPFSNERNNLRIASLLKLHKAAEHKRARHVICVNRPRFGAAIRFEGHLAKVLGESCPEDVVVVLTDGNGPIQDGKFPKGVRVVDLFGLTCDLTNEQRTRVLIEFLRSLCPENVFNVNALLLWDAMQTYGLALADSTRIFACLFCNEQTAIGYQTGYPLKRVHPHFEQLAGVLTDSHHLKAELIERYMIPAERAKKIHVLPTPMPSDIQSISRPDKALQQRPQIFWAGRLDRQKRLDQVLEIARLMPDADFRIWGEAVLDNAAGFAPVPENIKFEGTYAKVEDLPANEADLWLYTSGWDGVPNIILEVVMMGIPLVSSDAGGIMEVLDRDHSICLDKDSPAEAWIAAIRQVLHNPLLWREKALELREQALTTRNQARLVQALCEVTTLPAKTGANSSVTLR